MHQNCHCVKLILLFYGGYLTRIVKTLHGLAVSQAFPAGKLEVTLAFNINSGRSVLGSWLI